MRSVIARIKFESDSRSRGTHNDGYIRAFDELFIDTVTVDNVATSMDHLNGFLDLFAKVLCVASRVLLLKIQCRGCAHLVKHMLWREIIGTRKLAFVANTSDSAPVSSQL